jgi:hypothetical protein
MRFNGTHERAHILVGGARSIDPIHKRRSITYLSCPSQDILISASDLTGRLRRRDRELIASSPEVRPLGGLDDLANDCSKDLVTRRKRDAPLDLDLEHGGSATCIVGVHDHVIERPTFGRTLELDAVDRRAW